MMMWYDEKLELDKCTVLSLAWPLELIQPLPLQPKPKPELTPKPQPEPTPI